MMEPEEPRDRTFDEIAVGEELLTLQVEVSQDHINVYQDFLGHIDPNDPETGWLVGNNLHVDEEYSRRNAFGGVIGDGHQTGQYLLRMVTASMPWGTLDAGYSSFDLKFTNPTRPGDVVQTRGQVVAKESIDGRDFAICEVQAWKQGHRMVATGTIRAHVPRRRPLA